MEFPSGESLFVRKEYKPTDQEKTKFDDKLKDIWAYLTGLEDGNGVKIIKETVKKGEEDVDFVLLSKGDKVHFIEIGKDSIAHVKNFDESSPEKINTSILPRLKEDYEGMLSKNDISGGENTFAYGYHLNASALQEADMRPSDMIQNMHNFFNEIVDFSK